MNDRFGLTQYLCKQVIYGTKNRQEWKEESIKETPNIRVCYLLNKLILNKLDLENLYCVVIGGQKNFINIFKAHCEIFWCLIKSGTLWTLFF